MQSAKSTFSRDDWKRILVSRTTRVDTIMQRLDEELETLREKELQEQTALHFLKLGNLLELCRVRYTHVLENMRVSFRIEEGVIHIEPYDKEAYSPHNDVYLSLYESMKELLELLSPWRKGPFHIWNTYIDSEWKSYKKWQRIADIYDVEMLCKDKCILDVGCNNGYYAFYMLYHRAQMVLGIDPMPRYSFYFELYRLLLPHLPLFYELWRVQDMTLLPECFDTIFCMGILYHQRNPLHVLEILRGSLKKNGILVLETICLHERGPYCLFPHDRYLKSKGYWFIPSVDVLHSWLYRTGYEVLSTSELVKTAQDEQHSTAWIRGESLESFLDDNDDTLTVEGYPAPYRVVMIARRRF